jgi:hypothetical protein
MPVMDDHRETARQDRRLRRQIAAMERGVPWARTSLRAMLEGRLRYLRLPLALLLIAGGFLGFLPVLGFWMIPLGLLLLAIDLPRLRPWVSAALVRLRRWARVRWRNGAGRRP